MAASTLALGTSSYVLLDQLDGADQLQVSKSASSTTIRSTPNSGGTIEALGITSGLGSLPSGWEPAQSQGTLSTVEIKSNVNVFANLSDFQASVGSNADTLNIFGTIGGSRIFLDDAVAGTQNGSSLDANDLLSVSGSIKKGSDEQGFQDNLIYTGSGNDTIRIAGSIEEAFVFLGAGNDSLTAGSGANVDVYGGDGNDYIQFKRPSTDVRINAGNNADTVVLSGLSGTAPELNGISGQAGIYNNQLIFSSQGQAAIDTGSGNDSLVLGSGSYFNTSFNTGAGIDTISIAAGNTFGNTYFQLGSDTPSISNKEKFTSAQNNHFFSTTIASNNGGGDSLIFGSGTQFGTENHEDYVDPGSTISLGTGADSIVFGSNSVITNSYINTGSGADTLVFGYNMTFTKTSINLGSSDGLADRICRRSIWGHNNWSRLQ